MAEKSTMQLSMMRIRLFAFFLLCVLFIPVLATAGSVTAGDMEGTSGSNTLVPLLLADADPMNHLDLTLSYDPKVCTALDVLPGDFTVNTTLTSALDRGEVRVALESTDGIGGEGVLAWIRFKVLASRGSSALRILSARSSTPLVKIDGRLTIIPGISFSRTVEGRQRVSVETRGSAATIEDTTISFFQGGMQILIRTEGIGRTAIFATGLVQNVTMICPSATATLSSGAIEGSYALTFPEYPSEGSLHLLLSSIPSSDFQDALVRSASGSNLNITVTHIVATPSLHGIAPTTPVIFSFTFPSTLLPGSNETFRLASREGNGPVTLIRPDFANSGDGKVYLQATISHLPSEIALLAVKEGPRSATTAARGTSGSILSIGTEAASGNIWGGMIMIFFLVAVVVIAVFYIHRRRSG
jgi:hypothetical protein